MAQTSTLFVITFSSVRKFFLGSVPAFDLRYKNKSVHTHTEALSVKTFAVKPLGYIEIRKYQKVKLNGQFERPETEVDTKEVLPTLVAILVANGTVTIMDIL